MRCVIDWPSGPALFTRPQEPINAVAPTVKTSGWENASPHRAAIRKLRTPDPASGATKRTRPPSIGRSSVSARSSSWLPSQAPQTRVSSAPGFTTSASRTMTVPGGRGASWAGRPVGNFRVTESAACRAGPNRASRAAMLRIWLRMGGFRMAKGMDFKRGADGRAHCPDRLSFQAGRLVHPKALSLQGAAVPLIVPLVIQGPVSIRGIIPALDPSQPPLGGRPR
jgi:hypothetical protein